MLKKIISTIVIVLFIFSFAVLSLPDDFRYETTAVIDAPASKIYPHINDLQKGLAWSPWVEVDPNMKNTFEGPKAGVGAVGNWEGNKDVGKGSQKIIESKKDEIVKFELNFIEPMQATNLAEISLKPEENGKTTVTWAMYGKSNFVGKVISLVFNCEKIVKQQFDKGLANLKNIVENEKAAPVAANKKSTDKKTKAVSKKAEEKK